MFDFYFFYAASIAISQGQSPYDTENLYLVLSQINAPHTINQLALGFPYPPYTLWSIAALSWLSFQKAMFAWFCFSLASITTAIKLIQGCLCRVFHPNETFVSLFVLSILFLPLLKLLSFGQISFIPLLGIALFYHLIIHDKNDFLSGAALSLTLLKPHIIALWLLAIIIYSFQSKKYKIISSLILGLVVQILVSFLIYPNGWSDFYSTQRNFTGLANLLPHATFIRLLQVYSGLQVSWIFAPVVIGAIYIIIDSIRTNWTIEKSILVYLPLSVVLAPFAWLHDQVILLPTYLLIIIFLFRDLLRVYRTVCVILFLFISTLIYSPRYEFHMWFLPVVILIAGILLQRKLRVRTHR